MGRIFGRHGRRKANVPNIVGLSRSAAQSALSSAGLTYTESTTNTSNIGLANQVASQNVVSSSVVLIGISVPLVYYNLDYLLLFDLYNNKLNNVYPIFSTCILTHLKIKFRDELKKFLQA
jgi:hypothetical protein